MKVLIKDSAILRIDSEAEFHGGFEPDVADELRHRLQILRSAASEETLFPLKSLGLERRVDGKSDYVMRVTDQVAMRVEFSEDTVVHARCATVEGTSPYYNKQNDGEKS